MADLSIVFLNYYFIYAYGPFFGIGLLLLHDVGSELHFIIRPWIPVTQNFYWPFQLINRFLILEIYFEFVQVKWLFVWTFLRQNVLDKVGCSDFNQVPLDNSFFLFSHRGKKIMANQTFLFLLYIYWFRHGSLFCICSSEPGRYEWSSID